MNEAIGLLRRQISRIKRKLLGSRLYSILRQPFDRARNSILYAQLRSTDYLDEAWYRLAYAGEIKYPGDLWHDYIWDGIAKGRDPSPYFNTILYRREHVVPIEKALLQFLRSGRAMSGGAYRDEGSLLAAQKSFREKTNTELFTDQRAATRPCAVFLQCGAGSVWGGWRPDEKQSWDLLINHYDSTYTGKIPCDVEFRQTGTSPGTKFTAFYSILEKSLQLVEPYEYILLLDDDVSFEGDDIARLFSIVQHNGWEMAQASLSADSHFSYPVFFSTGGSSWRQVNGVEIMMPVFSRRILGTVKELMGQSISGWGFDAALAMIATEQGLKAAVIDEIVGRHTKIINADIGAYYQMLHKGQIYPEIEFTHLQKKYGYTKPLFCEL